MRNKELAEDSCDEDTNVNKSEFNDLMTTEYQTESIFLNILFLPLPLSVSLSLIYIYI